MALTVGRGFALPGDMLAQEQVQDMSNRIHQLEDDESNVTKILQKLPKFPAHNTVPEWLIDQDVPFYDTLNEDLDDSETTVTVTDGAIWKTGEVFRITTTSELCRVTSVSGHDLTVTRGFAGTTAAAATDGDTIVKAGNAHSSGALGMQSDNVTPIATRIQPVRKTCPTEIFRTAVALSRSEMQTKGHLGTDRAYQRLKGMRDHRRMLELSLLYGIAHSSEPRMFEGFLNYVDSTNRNSTTTTLTDAQFALDLNSMMRYGKREKWAFISRKVAGIIEGWGLPLIRIDAGEKSNTWGVDIVRYKSPFGTVNFVITDALVGSVFEKYMILLEISSCRLRPLQDTVLRKDIHPPYADGVMDEYLTETAVEKGHPQHHGYWSDIAA